MALMASDWLVVGLYFAASLAIALYYARRAGEGTEAFFLSSRELPWWLAGTSMVATTFAADTPLAVTELVAKHGIAGNWLWWSQAFSALLTVFFFAKLWRRAGVMTDVELTELRYSGRPAAVLRAFRALYLALPINLIIMGWVNLGMATVLRVALGWEASAALWLCFALTALYTFLSGFWGVVMTDFFQFLFAMLGCVVLAVFAVGEVGGLSELAARVSRLAPAGPETLSLLPSAGSAWMPVSTFLTYLGVAWWASWYPGAEPGGGGYVAQRLFAAKDDRHAVGSALWFSIAHYAVRPWPWILVALASLLMYPGLSNPGEGYPRVMMEVLPSPFKGLLLAAFAAAYMSTLSTHINWGASYLVGDVYRRFLAVGRSEAHYVAAGRLACLLLAALCFLVTRRMQTISGAWMFLISIGAGCGAVYILRWYWWRINAWSEISAMVAAAAISLGLQRLGGLSASDPRQYAALLLLTVAGTTAAWLSATLLTPPEPPETLARFYRKVAPAPQGWGPVAERAGRPEAQPVSLMDSVTGWLLGCVCVYASLLATGLLLLGRPAAASLLAALAAASGWGLFGVLRRL